MDIIGLLSTDGYIVVNKTLIKHFGANCAILIGELCAEHKYYESTGALNEYGEFFSTRANIEANTGLNEYAQRTAIEELKKADILSVTRRGIPAKNYYRINAEQLCNLFISSSLNFKEQDPENLNLNNNRYKNNKLKENNNTYFVSIPAEPVADCKSSQLNEDYNSHGYSEDELKEELLQTKKSKKGNHKNLYGKCVDEIHAFTDNAELQESLINYLTMRLSVKDKPIRGVNQWKGMLKKLSALSGDTVSIVNQSLEKGWLSFYEMSNSSGYNKSTPEKFGETASVRCTPMPDNWREEERAKLEAQGRRTSF